MKTVLITGASRGIGKATALKFAKEGYNVIINYLFQEKDALALKDEIIKKYKVEVLVYKADVAIEEEVKKMITNIKNTFGKIDCLVNNAGIAIDNDYLDKSTEEFQKVLNVNLLGTFLVTKYASLIMDKGSIINISSNGAINDGYSEAIDYDASKAGIIALTHDFAKRLAPKIRVNAVAPGWINTDMNKDIEPNFQKMQENNILLNRFGEKEEVANVIYFLASEASSYINSTIIRVDGGEK